MLISALRVSQVLTLANSYQANAVTNYHRTGGNLDCETWVSYTPVRYIAIMFMVPYRSPLLITKTSRDNKIMYTKMYDSKC